MIGSAATDAPPRSRRGCSGIGSSLPRADGRGDRTRRRQADRLQHRQQEQAVREPAPAVQTKSASSSCGGRVGPRKFPAGYRQTVIQCSAFNHGVLQREICLLLWTPRKLHAGDARANKKGRVFTRPVWNFSDTRGVRFYLAASDRLGRRRLRSSRAVPGFGAAGFAAPLVQGRGTPDCAL